MYEEAFAQALGFNSDELELNRNGKISARQMAQLRDIGHEQAGFYWVSAGFLTLYLGYNVINAIVAQEISTGFIIFSLIVLCLVLTLVFIIYIKWLPIQADIASGEVRQSVGMLSLQKYYRQGKSLWPRYYFVVQNTYVNTYFPMSAQIVSEGKSYRVFFTPKSQILLSMESIDSDKMIKAEL